MCYYENATYDTDDSLSISVYNLLTSLDIDNDGLLDIKLVDQNVDFEAITITNVPSLWGPAIVEIRVWE